MLVLKNKVILILSPQSWGKMFISKHHYAVELAKKGNIVYFLDPPDKVNGGFIDIEPSGYENLSIIRHQLWFPYNLKFHIPLFFHGLMYLHIKHILRHIKHPIDIVWSFDLGNLYPFKLFPRTVRKIFHPVDEPLNRTAIRSAKGAEVIFSVTSEILEKYEHCHVPRFLLGHGISKAFLREEILEVKNGEARRVGLSGNFLREDIDRPVLLKIIRENPSVIFEFWGSYDVKTSNIGGEDTIDCGAFTNALHQSSNVVLHGVVNHEQLAVEIQGMDAFLICYDINKDQSKGSNYHKVLEYLATGKVVISNNISFYKDQPGLIEMLQERNSNAAMPELFKKIILKVSEYNSPEKIQERKAFAASHTYAKQLGRIDRILGTVFEHAGNKLSLSKPSGKIVSMYS